jgi:YD repeat-containing protein
MTQYRTRAGVTMSCTIDNRNRDTFCDWSDSTPDVTKTYDAAGRMLSLSNSVAASAFSYDAANQMLRESITISGLTGAKTVAYTYDADSNPTLFKAMLLARNCTAAIRSSQKTLCQ